MREKPETLPAGCGRSQGDETVKLSTVCRPICSSVQGNRTHSPVQNIRVWSCDHGEVGSSDWP